MLSRRFRSNAVVAGVALVLVPLITSCTPTAFLNLTVPTSDFAPGMGTPVPRRLQVGFINNTAFRAIFTAGSFDPLDKNTSPTNFTHAPARSKHVERPDCHPVPQGVVRRR